MLHLICKTAKNLLEWIYGKTLDSVCDRNLDHGLAMASWIFRDLACEMEQRDLWIDPSALERVGNIREGTKRKGRRKRE